jgi:Zn-dependent protease
MLSSSYTVARAFGIPIKVHISLLLTWLFLAKIYGPLLGTLVMTGLFTSIVLHELGHSLVAMAQGCRVREIMLMPIGGAAQLDRIPTRPMQEFLMAIAGPAVSLALGLAGIFFGPLVAAPEVPDWHINIFVFLGRVNMGLVVFNLLPSFPMDGGRVLRALLTPRMGRVRATYIAARLGKLMATLFGIYGVLPPMSLSLIAIAFFIYIAAGNEYRSVLMQEAAKRGGFASWPPFFTPPRPPPRAGGGDDITDAVIVSPPPYEDGPPRRAEIRSNPDEE